ncbi:hypothetical protein C467_13964 [Halorubrum hochstenium ATCC 700873]|uniref:Uncharacterized protein n=1 Tax=Halorubrum hochstenium ATCC 700873 TaxID=1227481 RepID=M0F1T9_9EURY|nr:hypothetical protein C467_13964 [Halorubrum hochstenium ATCC 700873]
MSFVSEIEAVFTTGSLKWSRTINEKDRVIYVVFFAEFREKPICDRVISRRFKPCV